MHAKSHALWQTTIYELIDGTCVANQIVRLCDSRSLRYAKSLYFESYWDNQTVVHLIGTVSLYPPPVSKSSSQKFWSEKDIKQKKIMMTYHLPENNK